MEEFLARESEMAKVRLVYSLKRVPLPDQKVQELLAVEVVTADDFASFEVVVSQDGLNEAMMGCLMSEIARIHSIPRGPLCPWPWRGGSGLHITHQAHTSLTEVAANARPILLRGVLEKLKELPELVQECGDKGLTVEHIAVSDLEFWLGAKYRYESGRVVAYLVLADGSIGPVPTEGPIGMDAEKWVKMLETAMEGVEIKQGLPADIVVHTEKGQSELRHILHPRLV